MPIVRRFYSIDSFIPSSVVSLSSKGSTVNDVGMKNHLVGHFITVLLHDIFFFKIARGRLYFRPIGEFSWNKYCSLFSISGNFFPVYS